jgi:DNA repair protein RadC
MEEAKQHYHGHRKRAKEKFLKSLSANSAQAIADYEILEIILYSAYPRQDTKPIAKDLIAKFGSLAGVFAADIEKLQREAKLSEGVIFSLKIINEASLRLLKSKVAEKPVIQSWKALLDYCQAAMSNLTTEQFRIMFLDKKNKLISDEVQQKGTVDQTPVYPREVVKRALELGASAIILVHNHPSGDASPSKADIEITEQIEAGLNAVDIKLHDHLIIAGENHFSFAGNGLV